MDAVNVAQLRALNTKLTADIKAASLAAGDNITIAKDGDTNKISLKDTITLGADNGLIIGNQEFTVKNADGTDKVDENGDVVKQSGNYITGLSNTSWDADNIVADVPQRKGN